MRVVVALGGNALLKRGEPMTMDMQRRNARTAAAALAPLARDHDVILTHGNGPQVGMLALQSLPSAKFGTIPLDVLDSETEGMIGYIIMQELANALGHDTKPIVALLTQVEVAADDVAFDHPTKPIGPLYTQAESLTLADTHGWSMAKDGDAFRRVVPSPTPVSIVEIKTIDMLTAQGTIVICAGGGGIPVIRSNNLLTGIEAVIDKDLTSALLATLLKADVFVMLTDVAAVFRGWGTPTQTAIGEIDPHDLLGMGFAEGSMGPKVQAACQFVIGSGKQAAIGRLEDAGQIVEGTAGTQVRLSTNSVRNIEDQKFG